MNNGIVYIMQRTRRQYHYAVRSARKHGIENRKQRVGGSLQRKYQQGYLE